MVSPPSEAATPGSYVIGLQVRGRTDDSPVLAQWEAEKSTSLVSADPGFDDLWPVPESGGRLITVGVTYGSNTLGLTGLRFDGSKLRVAGHWENTGFTITRAGASKRLVVIETAGIFGTNVPAIYAWTGPISKRRAAIFQTITQAGRHPTLRRFAIPSRCRLMQSPRIARSR